MIQQYEHAMNGFTILQTPDFQPRTTKTRNHVKIMFKPDFRHGCVCLAIEMSDSVFVAQIEKHDIM